jgi:hypothetical protein
MDEDRRDSLRSCTYAAVVALASHVLGIHGFGLHAQVGEQKLLVINMHAAKQEQTGVRLSDQINQKFLNLNSNFSFFQTDSQQSTSIPKQSDSVFCKWCPTDSLSVGDKNIFCSSAFG